jgi:hypothetical protein
MGTLFVREIKIQRPKCKLAVSTHAMKIFPISATYFFLNKEIKSMIHNKPKPQYKIFDRK